MDDSAGLVVENLGVSFAKDSLPVVRGIGFRIAPGEALGLVGESGSGKTLTARAILGLLPQGARATGRIVHAGTSLLDLPAKQLAELRGSRIAMIFQDPMSALNPLLRVGDAIAQIIRSHGRVDWRTALERAVAMLETVGIPEPAARARAFPHQFSGGMRQRILIAMALAAEPALLLADEPTTALDVIVQSGILALIDRLRRTRGMSLLFVSHDLAVVARVCDRVAVMYAGEIVEEGPVAEVLANPRMPYSIGLMASMPRPGKGGRLAAIPGLPPSPADYGDGCAFAVRCPIASDDCRSRNIAMVEVGPDHRVRCLKTSRTAPTDGRAEDIFARSLAAPVGDD